jgi:hypothetical protein
MKHIARPTTLRQIAISANGGKKAAKRSPHRASHAERMFECRLRTAPSMKEWARMLKEHNRHIRQCSP